MLQTIVSKEFIGRVGKSLSTGSLCDIKYIGSGDLQQRSPALISQGVFFAHPAMEAVSG